MTAPAQVRRPAVDDRLMDIDELAAYTCLKKKTLYDKVHHRKIPFIKIGQLLRFRLSDIDAWLEETTFRPD